jgi:serine protease Do
MKASSGFPRILLTVACFGVASAVACVGMPLPAIAGVAQAPDAVADVVSRVQPSVVRIVVVHPPAKPQASNTSVAQAAESSTVTKIGSGFVIGSGLVATNRHVVEDSVSIFVGTATGARYRAEIVGLASRADIALLKIDPDVRLPALTFGDSDKLRAGDTVIAIGSPFGFDNTVTAGIVSSVNRDIMESPFDDYIQTDAAINHGNSGGPLFNMAGEVVGMNSVLFAPGAGSVGVGFAIPANDLKFVFDRLRKYGDVRAGMLPIRTQQLTAMVADALGVPPGSGALIASLDPAADRMDGAIQLGDVITRFNNEPVADPRDLARKAAQIQVGGKAVLDLYRNGKIMSVEVPILPLEGSMPPALANDYHPKSLGLQFDQVAAGGQQAGVLLADINPSGSAADSGLRKGDVILRVQQQAVATPDQVLNALQSRIAAKQAYAALLVKRDDKQTWMPIALPE